MVAAIPVAYPVTGPVGRSQAATQAHIKFSRCFAGWIRPALRPAACYRRNLMMRCNPRRGNRLVDDSVTLPCAWLRGVPALLAALLESAPLRRAAVRLISSPYHSV